MDQAFSGFLNQVGVTDATQLKAIKTLAYDAVALGALELTDGKSEAIQMIGQGAAEVAKGLGTTTLGADPVYSNPTVAPKVVSTTPIQVRRSVPGVYM